MWLCCFPDCVWWMCMRKRKTDGYPMTKRKTVWLSEGPFSQMWTLNPKSLIQWISLLSCIISYIVTQLHAALKQAGGEVKHYFTISVLKVNSGASSLYTDMDHGPLRTGWDDCLLIKSAPMTGRWKNNTVKQDTLQVLNAPGSVYCTTYMRVNRTWICLASPHTPYFYQQLVCLFSLHFFMVLFIPTSLLSFTQIEEVVCVHTGTLRSALGKPKFEPLCIKCSTTATISVMGNHVVGQC